MALPAPESASPARPVAALSPRVDWTLWATPLVAAGFCVCVAAALVVQHLRSRQDDPLKSPALAALKDQLHAEPRNEQLKEQIRALDQRLRERYFQQVSFQHSGAWLLVAGGVALVWSGKTARARRADAPRPRPVSDAAERQERAARAGRLCVMAVGSITGLSFLALAVTGRSTLPRQPADVEKYLARLAGGGEEESVAAPTAAELARQWPRFLGATGNAASTNRVIPDRWDTATGAGIRWRVSLTNAGFNSPVVWSNRVFVSAGDAHLREVFGFDANTGALLWRRAVTNVPGSPATPPAIPEGTGFAASTMAVDGRRVCALFGNGDLAAFHLDGRPAWSKNLGVPKNQYGHAASLALWEDRLIVQLDQGEAEQARSRLYAFDTLTGRVIWERTRRIPESWASPCLADAPGGAQIIALGGTWVMAYAARDGAELWKAEILTGEITPSPIFSAGLVMVVSPNDRLAAFRPDGQGDVTKSHLAWSAEDNVPDVSSPVSNGELVFTANTPGMLTCFDVKDGKKLWEHDLGFEVNATPTIAGDRILVLGRKGGVAVASVAREYKEISRFEMGEPILASPAIAADRLFIRSTQTLYCIGAGTGANATANAANPEAHH